MELFVKIVKGAFSGLRQFLATESSLNMQNFKNVHLGRVEKQPDQKDKVNFKIHDVTAQETNNCGTHIAQYLKKQRQLDN